MSQALKRFFRRSCLLVCLCLPALLSGCGAPGAEGLWQDYMDRLSRLARADPPPAEAWQRPLWPPAREVRLPTPEWRSGWLRYLDLSGCDLMQLVAERNSGLGRVQVPVVRFDYELRFIEQAQQCLASDALEPDSDMARWLVELAAEKRDALPALYWNAVVGGEELRQFLRQGDIPGTPPVMSNGSESVHALQALSAWPARLAGNPPADGGTLPEQLMMLDLSRGGGVIDALALANRELPRATALLSQVDTARLCPGGVASERARYFENVLHAVYAQRVQPWLSAVSRESRQLGDALGALLATAPAPVPAADNWLAQVFGSNGLQRRLRDNLHAHTQAWQTLLGDCGLMPKQPLT